MNTILQLRYNNEEFQIDINNDVEILLTYQAGDVRNVLSRLTSTSKTIVLPGSQNNNLVFKNIYDVTNSSDFNPNIKSYCRVITNGKIIFDGYLKLDRILKNNSQVDYECTLFSNVSNLFADMGNTKLDELDLSEWTHTYNWENIRNSWDTSIYKSGSLIGYQKGRGYVYPHIDWGEGGTYQFRNNTANFYKPALFTKTVLDNIFDRFGYTYTSDFFNSDYFKSLIITQDGKSAFYDELDIENSKANITSQDYLLASYLDVDIVCANRTDSNNPLIKVKLDDETSTGTYDIGNNFNTTTWEYTVPISGLYDINVNMFLNNTVVFDNNPSGDTLGTDYNVNGTFEYTTQICIFRNGVELQPTNLAKTNAYEVDADYDTNGSPVNAEPIEQVIRQEMILYAGDKVYVKCRYNHFDTKFCHPVAPVDKDVTVYFYQYFPSRMEISLIDDTLKLGAEQTFERFLGGDSCKDFLTSLAKMFNLFFYIDNENPNNLIIETRNEFYNGAVIDWTYKLDRQVEHQLIPTTEFDSQKLLFTYRKDADFWNTEYSDNANEEIYGQYEYLNKDNEFVDRDSETKLEVIWSPAPLILNEFYNVELATDDAKIETHIYSKSEAGAIKYIKAVKPRILFYKGLIPCNTYRVTNPQDSTQYALTTYAYAGMLDNPNTPTDSLEFGFPKFYFYNRTNITNSTLFSKFWESYLRNVFDKEAKLLIGNFYLTDNDIYELNFRNIIYLDGRYWIVNRILDYNPVTSRATKVELSLLIDYESTKENIDAYEQKINLNSGQFRMGDNGIGFFKKDYVGFFNPNINLGTSVYSTRNKNNILLGYDNELGGNSGNSLITGSGNTIGGGSSLFIGGNNNQMNSYNNNSLVLGDNNTFTHGLNESLLIGNNNSLIAVSNSFVFGNNNTLSGLTNTFVFGTGFTISDQEGYAYFNNLYVDNIVLGNLVDKEILFGNNGFIESSTAFTFDFNTNIFVSGPSHFNDTGSTNSVLIGGNTNAIVNNSTNSLIGGGNNNIITNITLDSAIIGGTSHEIKDSSDRSFIGGGENNSIETGSPDSFILGGIGNLIEETSQFNGILGGETNKISDLVNQSNILGGKDNLLSGGTNFSTIVGGQNNMVRNSQSSAIIGGNGLTLDNENDKVLVPNLKVNGGIEVYSGGTYSSGYTGNITLSAITQLVVVNGVIIGYI